MLSGACHLMVEFLVSVLGEWGGSGVGPRRTSSAIQHLGESFPPGGVKLLAIKHSSGTSCHEEGLTIK